jgi:hypothetical protein
VYAHHHPWYIQTNGHPRTACAGTSFPQLTLLSQAETEASLEAHLNDLGGHVERGVELLSFEQTTGTGGSFVSARLRHPVCVW